MEKHFKNPLTALPPMTVLGWINMIVVVGAMTSLVCWCVRKVVSLPDPREHIHPPIELDTPDMHRDE